MISSTPIVNSSKTENNLEESKKVVQDKEESATPTRAILKIAENDNNDTTVETESVTTQNCGLSVFIPKKTVVPQVTNRLQSEANEEEVEEVLKNATSPQFSVDSNFFSNAGNDNSSMVLLKFDKESANNLVDHRSNFLKSKICTFCNVEHQV